MMERSGDSHIANWRDAIGIGVEALIDDRVMDGQFSVRREAFTDERVFELEVAAIFEGTWVYLGLEAQVPNPHDFLTTYIGRQPVLLTRGGDGQLRCFLNTCRHRGSIVCASRSGSQRLHVCPYHAWTYDSSGKNVAVAQRSDGQYPSGFMEEDHGLTSIARLESYRGLIFGSLSSDVPSLPEHLGDARVFLDIVIDQSPRGVEYVPGSVTYSFNGNWKLQLENGVDFYHFQATHASYADILRQRVRSGVVTPPESYENHDVQPAVGSYGFDHGHAVMYAIYNENSFYRRPLAQDPGSLQKLIDRVGPVRARWMLRQRNLTIFPNLQIVDISALQLRTWRPLSVSKTEISSHCLAPVGESPTARRTRIRNYEEFFNPTGLGSSDDNVMYEYLQTGYSAIAAENTQGYLRGLGQSYVTADPFAPELGISPKSWSYGPPTFGDETVFHTSYREWRALLIKHLKRREG